MQSLGLPWFLSAYSRPAASRVLFRIHKRVFFLPCWVLCGGMHSCARHGGLPSVSNDPSEENACVD